MSNKVSLYLPPNCRIERVGVALALLSGVPKPKNASNAADLLYNGLCRFRTHEHDPEMVHIEFTVPGRFSRSIVFFFETQGHQEYGGPQSYGWKHIFIPSTPYNVALCRAMVDIFGGKVIHQDVSSKSFNDPDYERPAYRNNGAGDGRAYDAMMKRLASIEPLTKDDIKACVKFAGYDEVEGEEGAHE